jgi:HK97 family phage portal protein
MPRGRPKKNISNQQQQDFQPTNLQTNLEQQSVAQEPPIFGNPEMLKTYETSRIGVTSVSFSDTVRPKTSTSRQLEKYYKNNDLIRQCIDAIAYAVIGSGYHFRPKYGTEINKKQMLILEKFFEEPNSEDDMLDLLLSIALDLLTYGNCWVEIGIDKDKELDFIEFFKTGKEITTKELYDLEIPYQLFKVSALNMEIRTDENGKVIEYIQRGIKKDLSFKPDKLVHFKIPSPLDEIVGIAPASTLANTIIADLYAENYNCKFFENNATPRLHFDLGNVTVDELLSFAGELERNLKGQPHRNIVTRGGVKITPISLTNTDMEFSKYQEHLRTRIFGAFKMQPIILGILEATKSGTSDAQIALFKSLAVDPIRRVITSRLNRKIIRRLFPGTDLRFEFNPIDRLDALVQSKIDAVDLEHQVRVVNEVRAQRGLSPMPYGDFPILPYTDASKAVLKPKNQKEEEENNE